MEELIANEVVIIFSTDLNEARSVLKIKVKICPYVQRKLSFKMLIVFRDTFESAS